MVGAVGPVFGLVAALLYRRETDEPMQTCPRCGRVTTAYDAICTRCGAELNTPDRWLATGS